MTADDLAERLAGRGIDVRRHGREYRTHCPVHDDPSPSCDFRDGDTGIVVSCRAGCDNADILAAWEVPYSALFYDDATLTHAPPATTAPPARLPTETDLARAVDRLASDRAMLDRLATWRHWDDPERLRKLGVGLAERGRLVFPVRDGNGELVGVTEYDADPKRPESRPKAVSTGTRELWPTPEFHRDGELWLVEGESDAITALTLGLNASGVPGVGWWAGKRGEATARRLQGRSRVFVLGDCDERGRDFAKRAATDLAAAGIDTRIVDLDPSRSDGWDLSALFADAQGNADVARRFVADLAKHARRVEAPAMQAEEGWPQPMSDDAFVGLAGRIVRELEPTVEADRVGLLLHFLVSFGNAVGSSPHMVLGRRRHSCVVFALIVGRTAKARKGTAWAAVEEVMTDAARIWHDDRIVSGLSSGEGLIHNVRDPIYERMRKHGGESEEYDGEEDADGYVSRCVDPGVEDKRLLVVEQEFAQPLRLMRREGNPLSQYLRTLWDSGRAAAMTKHSPTKATNAHVSIIGHIVRDELEREMRAVDWYNGFANRFLFVCVRRSRMLPDPPVVDEWKIRELGQEVATAIEGASNANLLIFDPDAQRLWSKVYRGELSVDRYGILGAATARAEPYVARLSMLYALLDNSDLIRPKHLRAALAVWRYCDSSARYLFAKRGVGEPDADRVRDVLKDGPLDGMSRTQIHAALGRHWKAAKLDGALTRLVGAGVAIVERVETGGRIAERWRLNE